VKLLIIRPEPGASNTATRVIADGHEPVLLPFFRIVPRHWSASPPEVFDALLFTSANAVRHAGNGLDAYRSMPAHAVGTQTANALREHELHAASQGSGGVEEALCNAHRAGHDRLLWLTGEDHMVPSLPEGMTVERAICYASEAASLPANAASVVADADIVMLHSPRAARHFRATIGDLGPAIPNIAIAAFSPAIAAAAGSGWRDIAIAVEPTDSALLSAITALARLPMAETVEKDGE
jgi:uroporphyrinogen-III synthase